MRPDDVGLGGFDSHTLPPAGARGQPTLLPFAFALALALALPALALAQPPDSVPAVPRSEALRAGPPVSPRRAFLYSVTVPGLGQAALNRRYTGATFFLVEAVSLALVHRSAEDLRTAREFRGDSVPFRYDIDPETGLARRDAKGDPIVAEWQKAGYTDALVRARRLQLEDWVAVVIFNHLFAGADAFVAAQLWDLPEHVKLRAFARRRGGVGLALSVAVR